MGVQVATEGIASIEQEAPAKDTAAKGAATRQKETAKDIAAEWAATKYKEAVSKSKRESSEKGETKEITQKNAADVAIAGKVAVEDSVHRSKKEMGKGSNNN